jgi:hypothetical protein
LPRWPLTRWLTALGILGLCGFALSRGWEITRFAEARSRLGAHQKQNDAVKRWAAVPGLAEAALAASLARVADTGDIDDARRRAAGLTAILSVHPLSSADWLSLSGMRLVTGQPYEQVLGTLAMSSVTGRNEGSVMLQRGIFGLLQWEVLPPETRERTIADLAGALLGTTVRDVEVNPAKNVLAGKSADVRREIADRLSAEGVAPSELARMGL